MDKYTILPFGPTYYARHGTGYGPLQVEPMTLYYASKDGDDDSTSGISVCNYINATSKPINCLNLTLLFLLGVSALIMGVAMK
jgi:hypothetical protein